MDVSFASLLLAVAVLLLGIVVLLMSGMVRYIPKHTGVKPIGGE